MLVLALLPLARSLSTYLKKDGTRYGAGSLIRSLTSNLSVVRRPDCLLLLTDLIPGDFLFVFSHFLVVRVIVEVFFLG